MNFEKLDIESARQFQPLALAMVGDSVHTLYVREYIAINLKVKVNKMSSLVSSVVNAGAQFRTMMRIEDKLSEDEKNLVSRARNTHIHSKSKNYSVHEYIYATAFEALLGYLYLSGQDDRLSEILNDSIQELKIN